MILLFKLIILTYLIVMGLKIAMSEKMLLERLGAWLEQKVEDGYKIYDLFYCPWCSGTLYAIPAHGFAFALGILPFEWNWQLVARYPLIVGGCSLISGLTWTIYLTINKIKDKNEQQYYFFNSVNYEREHKSKSDKP